MTTMAISDARDLPFLILNETLTSDSSAVEDMDQTDPDHLRVVGLDPFSIVFGVWITGAVSIFGVTGNGLSFVALRKTFGRQSPMFYVLRILSVSDAVFLTANFVVQTMVNLELSFVHQFGSQIQYVVWPVLMTAQMVTVWLTVLVSWERFIAICRPLEAATVCTLSKVRSIILIIFAVSIIFNIPRYFEYDLHMHKTIVANNFLYSLYSGAFYSLLLYVVPLTLLLLLNVKLVCALKRSRDHWSEMQVNQRREQNLTVIPLTIVLVFFLCGTPSLCVNIADSVRPDLFGPSPNLPVVYVLVVANLLVAVNSASNFIIYCLLGKKFRTKVVEMFLCSRCCRTKKPLKHRRSVVVRCTNNPVSTPM